ncbi:3-hydroxyacyl-ACP dehydratase FabZ family protein [Flavobacterium sp.]
MTSSQIIALLPYTEPFLFVDEIIAVSEEGVKGTFTFDENLDFYKGHFKDNPITPGVILVETMAQIGVVCLGIYLITQDKNTVQQPQIVFTSSEVEFLLPVFPNEKVTVISEKVYFRFGKLKCKVKMINALNKEVCSGTIAGIIKQ